MTLEEAIQRTFDYIDSLSDEQLHAELEQCKDSPLAKALEEIYGDCDECLKENGKCSHCILGT
jgi:hypothetical protein